MTIHKRSVHEGIKDYKCPTCGEAFAQAGILKKHIRSVHEGVKDTCTICGKKSFSKWPRYGFKIRSRIVYVIKQGKRKAYFANCKF